MMNKLRGNFVANMNPFIKLLTFLTMVGLSFAPIGITGQVIMLASTFAVFAINEIKWKHFFSTLKLAVFMWVILSLIFTFTFTTGDYYFMIGNTPVSVYSVQLTLHTTLRIWTILLAGTLFTKTTSDGDIAWSFTTLIYPLKFIKIPVERIGTTLSMALKFIPQITYDIKEIRKAQRSRGINKSKSRIASRMKGIITIFTPLFVLIFKRALTTSNAMTIGGYDLDIKKTKYKKHKFTFRDLIGFIILAGIIVFVVLMSLNMIPRFADLTWLNINI